MIIFRYLAREIIANLVAVSAVLLLIVMSGRFVRYLAEAAAGKLDAGVLFALMGYRLPAYMELILPLGLFIAILLAYGRLYVESEMTVLSACGVSDNTLLKYTLVVGLIVATIVGMFSLYVGPIGVKASETLLAKQRSRSEFETLKPGRFHELSGGGGVSYAQEIVEDGTVLEGVFLAGAGDTLDELAVMTAAKGETLVDPVSKRRYLVLSNGYQYHGEPGEANYKVTSFEKYSQYLPTPEFESLLKKKTDSLTTLELLSVDSSEASAAIQWRISLPVLVLVVTFLAVPMSRTQPRKGRYVKLIPAILLYIVYLVLSNGVRGLLEDGTAPTPYLLWYVHAAFFCLALVMLYWPRVTLAWRSSRSRRRAD